MKAVCSENFEGNEIVGTNHEPSRAKKSVGKFISYVQFIGLGATFNGRALFRTVFPGVVVPDVIAYLEQNKFHSLLMIHLVGNVLKQNFMNTGAFEIYYDGEEVFSKLKMNRMPTVEEIVDGIRHKIEASGGRYTKPIGTVPGRLLKK